MDDDRSATPQPAHRRTTAWVAAVGTLGLSLVASRIAGAFIIAEFPDRPMPRDALFELLPYVSWARYLTVVLFGAFVILAVHTACTQPQRIPAVLMVFGLMYLFRAGIMALTPLASSYGPGSFVFPMVQPGMFPSGHAGAATLSMMLVDRAAAPRVKAVQAVLMVIVWVGLILARGHYSIDVVGGALLAYFVANEWLHGRLLNPVKRLVDPERI